MIRAGGTSATPLYRVVALLRRLPNHVDLSELGRELQQVAYQTMQPTTVAVWVRELLR